MGVVATVAPKGLGLQDPTKVCKMGGPHPSRSSVLTVRLEPPTPRLAELLCSANHCATSSTITYAARVTKQSPIVRIKAENAILGDT